MNFYLSDPHIKFLEEESKKLDINMSEIIRNVLSEYIIYVKERSNGSCSLCNNGTYEVYQGLNKPNLKQCPLCKRLAPKSHVKGRVI